jgi:hypothetical protein
VLAGFLAGVTIAEIADGRGLRERLVKSPISRAV